MALTLLPVVASPGASFTLAVSQIFAGHRLGPLHVAFGTSLGAFTLALCFGTTGLITLIAANPMALRGFAILGGLVLIFMGLQQIRASVRGSTERSIGAPRLVWTSYLTLISNPKALAVYLLIAPQTMSTIGPVQYLAFAGTHALLLIGWLGGVATLANHLPALIGSPTCRRWLSRATGPYLICLGLAVAMR